MRELADLMEHGGPAKTIFCGPNVVDAIRADVERHGLSQKVRLVVPDHWQAPGYETALVAWDHLMERPDVVRDRTAVTA